MTLSDEFTTIDTWPALEALAPEWEGLSRDATASYLTDSFAWAKLSWDCPLTDSARGLFCVVGRRAGHLALVWPFVVRRHRGFRIAQPLATTWGDYSTVPVAGGPAAEELVGTAWSVLRRRCPADLIHLPFVRQGSLLNGIVSRQAGCVLLHSLPAPWVCWDGLATFDDYLHRLSPAPRRDLLRKERRLAEMGRLRFESITDAARARPAIDWMLFHKARWLDRSGKQDTTWIRAEQFRTFLCSLMETCGPSGRCIIHILMLDDKPIAADLSAIDAVRVGWYMGTFDDALARHSPGNVLKLLTLRWAFERGLIFDMRLGEGEHKRFWANRVETTLTWRAAVSSWGRAYVFGRRAQPIMNPALRRLRFGIRRRAA